MFLKRYLVIIFHILNEVASDVCLVLVSFCEYAGKLFFLSMCVYDSFCIL